MTLDTLEEASDQMNVTVEAVCPNSWKMPEEIQRRLQRFGSGVWSSVEEGAGE